MSVLRALLLFALVAPAASAAELKTLKGESLKGELVSISDKEIVLEVDGKKVSTPIPQVLHLNLKDGFEKIEGDTKYAEVELTDGTLLKCSKVELIESDAKLTLLGGPEVKLPLVKISSILNEANNEDNRKQWKEKVTSKKQVRDILGLRKGDVINPFPGTLGNAEKEGNRIEFVRAGGDKRSIPVEGAAGFYFQRSADPKAKPALCKFYDTKKNLLYAANVSKTNEGFTVTTSAGVTVTYATDKVARLDYSKGKLEFLSRMAPLSVKENSTEGKVVNFRRDENFDGEKIRLAGVNYNQGLCLHSTSEVEYDLDGEYRELQAMVGIDEIEEEVTADDGAVVLKIIGDGKELYSQKITRSDKERARPIVVNIQKVQKLKILVTSDDLLDLGKHLALADARVSK
ncbi:MAG: NPCBM/NEW2 domain-containing protein [Planctomycetes bacterium]|nr:NPCBM/NEW2 domain-containing protein [Planctomycetota bacterium]